MCFIDFFTRKIAKFGLVTALELYPLLTNTRPSRGSKRIVPAGTNYAFTVPIWILIWICIERTHAKILQLEGHFFQHLPVLNSSGITPQKIIIKSTYSGCQMAFNFSNRKMPFLEHPFWPSMYLLILFQNVDYPY